MVCALLASLAEITLQFRIHLRLHALWYVGGSHTYSQNTSRVCSLEGEANLRSLYQLSGRSRVALIGSGICFFRGRCPHKCLRFFGSIHVGTRSMKYEIKLFKLMNWPCYEWISLRRKSSFRGRAPALPISATRVAGKWEVGSTKH